MNRTREAGRLFGLPALVLLLGLFTYCVEGGSEASISATNQVVALTEDDEWGP